MLRPILRYCFMLLVLMLLVIVFVIEADFLLPESVVMYSQPQSEGLQLWDMRHQRVFPLLSYEDVGDGPVSVPTWSPDGRSLAFILREANLEAGEFQVNDNLFMVDSAGRDISLLLDNSDAPSLSPMNSELQIVWSPDGRFLVFYMDTFITPQLWIISREGEIITQVARPEPQGALPDSLAARATILWSADSDVVYVVSVQNEQLYYQSLPATSDSSLSALDAFALPDEVVNIQALVPSPVDARLLLYDNVSSALWLLDIAEARSELLTAVRVDDLTALNWSDDGQRMGVVRHDSGSGTAIQTLTLANEQIKTYELPVRIAGDLSFNLFLLGRNQVILRMQRGSFCYSERGQMNCVDPDFFMATWFGLQP